MSNLDFTGNVAIVTGAGGGLGRSHALLLASRGARVVVNDLGGSFKGEGASQNAADKVVAEIREAGGTAVANYDSVENGEAIVKTALDEFGRVDIVVNNAGILRDVSFHKMTQEDWDLVYKVHVLGAFRVTHAAWPHMRDQGYGRIIMTASAAGIYGNFGQANYAMAKLGLAGFANTLAIEGLRKNIHVNTIAPIAGSRMTETVLPPNLIEALKPEYVSPLVAWLCHADCEETGALFEVGGGFFSKLRWERTQGTTFRLGREITPELIRSEWSKVTSFDKGTTHPQHIAGSMQPIMENVEAGPSKGGNELIDVDRALGFEFDPVQTKYDQKDLALYALAVGAAQDPMNEGDLAYVYEMHSKGMRALPTFAVIPALGAIMEQIKSGVQAPGLNYGFERILHGEQYTEVLRPLPTSAKLTHKARIKDIFDKGKHALVVTEIHTFDEDGDELCRNELTSLVRGAGGWGGDRGPSDPVNVPPDRKPDAVSKETVPANQALLYRLTGDINPLHADPSFAKTFGFDKPILHGLCTFGFAGRQVIQHFAKDADPRYFKSIRVRFADSVFPGETLVTEMWKESDTRVVFQTRVAERDSVVISNAAVEFYAELPEPKAKKKATAKSASGEPEVTSGDIFRAIDGYLKDNHDLAGRVGTVFKFGLSNPASTWTIDLSSAPGLVTAGEGITAKCTLELSDGDFMAMCTGKADPMKLFSTGKLKISGDIMASQKLDFLKRLEPERVLAEAKKRGGGADAGGTIEVPADYTPSSWDVFIAIRDHIERNPDIVGKIGYVFQFRISDPDSVWTVDLKNGSGGVAEGEDPSPDCTLAIAEPDFMSMTAGTADPMTLFTSGKLKISGNIMASQKLEFLQKIDPEEAKRAVIKAREAGEAPSSEGGGSTAAPAAVAEAHAPAIFEALRKRLSDNPGLKDEVKAVVAFHVSEPEGHWLIDLQASTPTVESKRGDADATFSITDADLVSMVKGDTSAQELFQRGQLRVDGDITVAHRLGIFKNLI